MNRKISLLVVAFVLSLPAVFAGGVLTNTNQSARFARMMALEAIVSGADAAYYNPAGTIRLKEGFHFTFSNQSAFQQRIITSSFAPLTGEGTKKYVGKASAPVIPSLQAVYRKGDWALSGGIAIVGGGGKATFDKGLPMFESQIAMLPGMLNAFAPTLVGQIPNSSLKAKGYSVNQHMAGTNYIFGGQIGGAYKINEMFSVYGGIRLNIVSNKYEGRLTDLQLHIESKGLSGAGLPDYDGMMNPSGIIAMAQNNPNVPQALKDKLALPAKMAGDGAFLKSSQSGWGIAPILGVNFNYQGLTVSARYEFKTALDVENDTKVDDTGQFGDGVNTAHDVPAMLALGVAYDVLPQLTLSAGYHHFFDKDAGMSNNKQRALTGGTNEYLFGAEWRINKMFLVSAGSQITRYGLADNFQSDLSFSLNSYSLGIGGAVNVSKNVQINAGYFYTEYSDYTKSSEAYNGIINPLTNQPIPGKDVYSRKNKVFTVGVDFSF